MVMKDPLKLLVVANPFPEIGGDYRAMKSLSEYPLYGIKPYLILSHIDSRSYNINIISSLLVKGIELSVIWDLIIEIMLYIA